MGSARLGWRKLKPKQWVAAACLVSAVAAGAAFAPGRSAAAGLVPRGLTGDDLAGTGPLLRVQDRQEQPPKAKKRAKARKLSPCGPGLEPCPGSPSPTLKVTPCGPGQGIGQCK